MLRKTLLVCFVLAAGAIAANTSAGHEFSNTVGRYAATSCENNCKTDRNDCMAEGKKKGGPRPQQCVQEFRQCLNACKKKKASILPASTVVSLS